MTFLAKNNKFPESLEKHNQLKNVLYKLFITSALIFLIVLMFPKEESYFFDYKLGAIWTSNDLIAPFSFPIFKDKEQYKIEVEEAKEKVYPVFVADPRRIITAQDSLNIFFETLKSLITAGNTPDSVVLTKFPFLKDDEFIRSIKKIGYINYIEKEIQAIFREVYTIGILDIPKAKIRKSNIAIRRGVFEEILPINKFYDEAQALKFVEEELNKRFENSKTKEHFYNIISNLLQPNIIFNQEETDKLILAAIENVPKTIGFVQQNEKIISKHERITLDTKLKLESLEKILSEKEYQKGSTSKVVGQVLHTALVLLLFGVYLFLFRKKVFYDNKKLILISIIILIQVLFSYLSFKLNMEVSVKYLIFLPASAMLLTIIYDSRLAFFGSVVMAFLVAAVRGNDYELALVMLVAATLSAYTVRNIKQRTQIFRSMIFIFIGLGFSVVAFGLERSESFINITQNLGLVLINSIISPILTYGLLIFFEKSFNVTTDLTLMELTDPNHPLLKILREKTPGTYHHSMVLGNLAEAAAFAINANPILAKVGAYYHDIGKTTKPEYFIENEFQKRSRHQRLTPRMSARIIIAHVKDGIELAREYGLPEEVIKFIPEHHGTTRLSYFYDKALKQAAARKSKHEVNEADYRYPGPKPQSKETAIVMLADIVEAFTRSLQNLTASRLESAIDERIKMRFIEGELNECNLTLKDLTKIKEAFLQILIGTYHQRIEYPQAEEAEKIIEASQDKQDVKPEEGALQEKNIKTSNEIDEIKRENEQGEPTGNA